MKNPFVWRGGLSLLVLGLAFGFPQKETSGIVEVEGAHLRYFIQGNGIPCVSLGAPIPESRVMPQRLRKDLKLIFLSLRHDAESGSTMDLGKITIDTYTGDIEQARKALGLKRIAVMGHSGHGVMALGYALKYPQNTSHVIMIGTPPTMGEAFGKARRDYLENRGSDERKAILKQNAEKLTKDLLDQMTPMERFSASFSANAPMYFYDLKYDPSWIFKGFDYNLDVLNYVWGQVLPANGLDKIPGKIGTPVFVAQGKYDFVVPPDLWDEAMKANLSDLSFNLFEKSGHFPMLEESDLFAQRLTAWIKSH